MSAAGLGRRGGSAMGTSCHKKPQSYINSDSVSRNRNR